MCTGTVTALYILQLFSASVDTARTTLKTAGKLSRISIRRKGQYSISVIVIRSEAQVISPDPACPNQSAGGGSGSRSARLPPPCAGV